VRPEGLGKLKKFIHLIGSRIRDLPTCRTVPLPRAANHVLGCDESCQAQLQDGSKAPCVILMEGERQDSSSAEGLPRYSLR
jgi:hypothetical protein